MESIIVACLFPVLVWGCSTSISGSYQIPWMDRWWYVFSHPLRATEHSEPKPRRIEERQRSNGFPGWGVLSILL